MMNDSLLRFRISQILLAGLLSLFCVEQIAFAETLASEINCRKAAGFDERGNWSKAYKVADDAVTVCEQALKQQPNSTNVMAYLGRSYYRIDKLKESHDLIESAAKQGNVVGMGLMGVLYENGYGVDKDLAQAASWYLKAAQKGSATAQNNLGLFLFYGKGIVANKAEAKKWLDKAAAQELSEAQDFMVKNYGELSKEPILRIETGEHLNLIHAIASDAQGRWLVTASKDKTARVWDLRDGRLLNTLRVPIGNGIEGSLSATAISPDGAIVALGGTTPGKDNPAYLFDRANGHILRIIDSPYSITALAFSPNGKILAVMLAENGLHLFSVSDGRVLAEDLDYGDTSHSVQFDNKGGRLVTTSQDGFLRLYAWNGSALKLISKRTAPGGSRPDFARFSPDGKNIAVGFDDAPKVNVLNAADLSFSYAPDMAGVDDELATVAWTPSGLVAAGKASAYFGEWIHDHFIRYWQGKTFQDFPTIGKNVVTDLLPLPGERLAYSNGSGFWGVLDRNGKHLIQHSSPVADFRNNKSGFTVSADGAQVGFSLRSHGRSPAIFDINRRQFLDSRLPNLVPPHLQTTRINVSDWENSTFPKFNGQQLEGMTKDDKSTSLALLPNDAGFVLGTNGYLKLYDSDGHQRWYQDVLSVVWAVNVSQDGRWVVAAHGDGTIRWYRASDGVEQLAFFPHADKKRWVMWTPEGYYDASPNGESLIGWHLNQGKDKEARYISNDQLYDVFYRPDIVQAKFKGEDISKLITITAAQALKRPPPNVSFTQEPQITTGSGRKVCYQAKSTGGGIGEIRLFQNKKLIKISDISQSSKDSYEECQVFEAAPGNNEIGVVAFDKSNTIQSKLATNSFLAGGNAEEPHLYVLSIGINKFLDSRYNLSGEAESASKFQSLIKSQANGLYKPQYIHTALLTDGEATKSGILNAMRAIAEKARASDTFILSIGTHGVLGRNGGLYIAPSDGDSKSFKASLISTDEIVEVSKNIKALSQWMIFDTCFSGGVVSGLFDARVSTMSKKMGLHIFASSESTQNSFSDYAGGVFMQALLDKLQDGRKLDSNHDAILSIDELSSGMSDFAFEVDSNRVDNAHGLSGVLKQTSVIRNSGADFPLSRLY